MPRRRAAHSIRTRRAGRASRKRRAPHTTRDRRAPRSRRARRRPRRLPHVVSFNVPERPLKHSDIVFIVRRGNRKIGELRISQGGLDWFPRKARTGYSINWERFQKILENA